MTALGDNEKATKEEAIYGLHMEHYRAQHAIHKDTLELRRVQLKLQKILPREWTFEKALEAVRRKTTEKEEENLTLTEHLRTNKPDNKQSIEELNKKHQVEMQSKLEKHTLQEVVSG